MNAPVADPAKTPKRPDRGKIASDLSNEIGGFFAREKMWRLSAKVVAPALLVSLLFGCFVFADQMLVQHLAPFDGNAYFAPIQAALGADWANALAAVYGTSAVEPFKINQDLIRGALTYSGAIVLVVLSLGLFVSTGASVLYSKGFASNDAALRAKAVSNGFWGSLGFGVAFGALMAAAQSPILAAMLSDPQTTARDSAAALYGGAGALAPEQAALVAGATQAQTEALLFAFYSGRNDAILKLANDYVYFLSACVPLASTLNFFVFMLRVEKKNLWITCFAAGANALNVFLDFVLIYWAKAGMAGSGAATLLGYSANLGCVLAFVWALDAKGATELGFARLRPAKPDPALLRSCFALGSGTFLRDLSLAVANVVYVPVWAATISATGGANVLVHALGVSPAPIYNLFFFAIFGIADGLRPIMAYNHSAKNPSRVAQTFRWGMYIGLLYASAANAAILTPAFVPAQGNAFLVFLGAGDSAGAIIPLREEILRLLLPAMMLQLPFLALTASSIGYVQATERKTLNAVFSVAQGSITFFPTLYSVSAIAVALNSWRLMVFAGFVNIVVSSLAVFAAAGVCLWKSARKAEAARYGRLSLS